MQKALNVGGGGSPPPPLARSARSQVIFTAPLKFKSWLRYWVDRVNKYNIYKEQLHQQQQQALSKGSEVI